MAPIIGKYSILKRAPFTNGKGKFNRAESEIIIVQPDGALNGQSDGPQYAEHTTATIRKESEMTTKKVSATKFQSPKAVESLPEWQLQEKERARKLAKEKVNSLALAIYAYLREEGLGQWVSVIS